MGFIEPFIGGDQIERSWKLVLRYLSLNHIGEKPVANCLYPSSALVKKADHGPYRPRC